MFPLILTVRFYRSTSGREPVREWLKHDLSLGARQAIGTDIKKSDKTPRDELELAKQRRNEVHA
jgi:hypothetical protein